MSTCTYLIIGNGITGTTAADQIRKQDPDGSIIMVTSEATPFYSRIRLNEYLAGELSRAQLIVRKPEWYSKNNIDLRLSTTITEAGSTPKTVRTDDGEEIHYDKLLMAQGASPFIPPIPGHESTGVFGLRSLEDADAIIHRAKEAKQIILIGGGLLGLEAGYALSHLGKPIHVVEFFPRLLPRQLDNEGSQRLIQQLEPMGFTFHLGAETEAINNDGSVSGISIKNGATIPGELVIISAGVRPNTALGEALNLDCERGILVSDTLQTSDPDIFAAGDVANHNGINYGIWPAAMAQGKIAGLNMAGGTETYPGTVMANSLKVAGVSLASAGNIDANQELEALTRITDDSYTKLVMEDDCIVGCIMLGDVSQFGQITRHIKEKTKRTAIDNELLATN